MRSCLILVADIGCNTDQGDSIFVGYDSLMIFEVSLTALWGQDIVDDPLPQLKIYMECIPGKFMLIKKSTVLIYESLFLSI